MVHLVLLTLPASTSFGRFECNLNIILTKKSYSWLESCINGISGDSRHCPADVIEFTWNVVIELKTAIQIVLQIGKWKMENVIIGNRFASWCDEAVAYLLVVSNAIISSR